MNRSHRIAVAGLLATMVFCTRAHAQALDQVPDGALAVLKIRNVQDLSAKAGKLAKDLGLDQLNPQMADPLSGFTEELNISKGFDKNGEMAVAFLDAEKQGGAAPAAAGDAGAAKAQQAQNSVVFVIPVDDYQAFLGNFENVKAQGGEVSQATIAKTNQTVYIAHRGKYAVVGHSSAAMSKQAKGLKLQGQAAKEADTKDAVIYANMKALRPKITPGFKQAHDMINGKGGPGGAAAANNPMMPKFTPVMKALFDQYITGVEQFVNDANSVAFSINLSDAGISTAMVADFEPGSYLGKLTSQVQNTSEPLAAGLPNRAYFAFGGIKLDPKVAAKVMEDFVGPVRKAATDGGNGAKAADGNADNGAKEMVAALDAIKDISANTNSVAFGYAMPAGAAGQESFIQAVMVAHGNAKVIHEGEKKAINGMGQMALASAPRQGKNPVQVDMKPDATTVDGVSVDQYTMKFNLDRNDPASMQAQQMLSMMYGRNGMTGALATVDDKTFVMVQGGADKLMADAIASAKGNQNALTQAANVKSVTAQLPKERVLEYYIQLDNIATAGVKFAKMAGLPVNFKLPPNLPPIGIAAETAGPGVRVDSFVPAELIQSLVSAGIQTFMQMNGGPGGAGGGL